MNLGNDFLCNLSGNDYETQFIEKLWKINAMAFKMTESVRFRDKKNSSQWNVQKKIFGMKYDFWQVKSFDQRVGLVVVSCEWTVEIKLDKPKSLACINYFRCQDSLPDMK